MTVDVVIVVIDASEILAERVAVDDRPVEELGDLVRDRRLAGTRPTSDEDDSAPRSLEVVERLALAGAGDLDRGRIALTVAHDGDLGPHVRPVSDVVMGERGRMTFAGQLAVPVHQSPRRVRAGEPLDVHHEEGDVGEDVADAVVVVEGDAVEDAGTVVEHEDVVGGEIAVHVADEAALATVLEHRSGLLQVGDRELAHSVELASVEHGADRRLDLVEARRPEARQSGRRCHRERCRDGAERSVERGNGMGDSPEVVVELGSAGQAREAAVGRETPHHEHSVDRLAALDHVAGSEVHVGCEAAVQHQLRRHRPHPCGGVAMVEEVGVERLQQLVDALGREEQHGDVRLDRSDVGVCCRVTHRPSTDQSVRRRSA